MEKALGICGRDNNGSNVYSPELLFGNDGKCFVQHLTAAEIQQRVGEAVFRTYFKLTIVRHPFARLVSAFLGSHFRDMPFERFVERVLRKEIERPLKRDCHRHFKPQTTFLNDRNGHVLVDLVLRQEDLAAGVKELNRRTSAQVELPRKNGTRGGSYQEYFNDRTRRLVEGYYSCDLQWFGYAFENVPSMQAGHATVR